MFLRISSACLALILIESGRYSSLVFLIIPGMRTKSICSGNEKRPAIGDPVRISILMRGANKWVAIAMVLRMCPRPYESCEYIKILYVELRAIHVPGQNCYLKFQPKVESAFQWFPVSNPPSSVEAFRRSFIK